MTSTSLTNMACADHGRSASIASRGWVSIVVLGLLFVGLFHYYLWRMFNIALTDNNWSHALVVPIISAFYIFQNRDRLAALPRRICWWGLPILLTGMFGYALWTYPGRNDMFTGYSMILALFGLVLFLAGTKMMRVLWFPVVFLAFGVKVAERLWDHLAWQLQQIAASGATLALKCFGVLLNFDANHQGSRIDLIYPQNGQWLTHALNVAEACSGLRMLMAFVALAAALAFLWERPWWQRLGMILMAVPIAVAINIARVTVIGLLYIKVDPAMASGSFHIFVGMLMLIPAGALFLLTGWILDHLIVHDERDADAAAPRTAPRAADAPTPTVAAGEITPPARLWPPQFRQYKPFVIGGIVGAALAALIGLGYGLALAAIRPDLVLTSLPRWSMMILLVLAAAAVAALVLTLIRRMPRQTLRRHAIATGVAGGMLLTAMAGQAEIIRITKAVLIKEPVPLRHSLALLPQRFGTWKLVQRDPALAADVLEALGTDQYMAAWYRDTSWPANKPGGMVHLHIAYYTGTPDTVPHVPDRCYVANGAAGLGTDTIVVPLAGEGYRPDPANGGFVHSAQLEPMVHLPSKGVEATDFRFADPSDPQQTQNVIYFFLANGKYLANPDQVRLMGFDPRDKYAYYCKVEMLFRDVPKGGLAKQRASDLLSVALPEIMACLPDWVDVTAGRYPAAHAKTVTTEPQRHRESH